jgi:carboxyl-terminal processing protease
VKKISVFVLAAALAVVFMIPAFSEQKKADMTGLYKEIELFADAVSLIRMYYVDTINAKTLVRGALKGMMQSLDDYSQYMEPENYEEMKADTKGEFGGLGIEIGIRDGMLTIISPMDGIGKKGRIQQGVIVARRE